MTKANIQFHGNIISFQEYAIASIDINSPPALIVAFKEFLTTTDEYLIDLGAFHKKKWEKEITWDENEDGT